MKKAFFRKSKVATVLLALLVFSAFAYSAPLVQADRQGIGKFVDIEVIGGGGAVILTKLSSGETWATNDALPENHLNEKVGAGTVRVDAIEESNYVFDHWEIDEAEFFGLSHEIKAEKGTIYVKAYFKEVFTIIACVADNAPNGTIALTSGGVTNSTWILNVEKDESLEFWLYANEGNHISAIAKNGTYEAPKNIVELKNIQANYVVAVYFSQDGYAWVPPGDNVEVYFTPGASLQFDSTSGGDAATGIALVRPEEWAIFYWNISTLATDTVDGLVVIALELTGGPLPTEVARCDTADAFYCDVNNDDFVDAKDVSLVANANKATETNPNGFEYNQLYDTNRDGRITEADVHFVNNYKGTEIIWTPLNFWFNENNTIIYISTEHFSPFRAR